MDWYQIKQSVELFTGLHMDALHVHVGVLAQIAAALTLRRTLGSPLPWLLVLTAAVGNEAYDLAYETWPEPERERQLQEGIRDIWNTMLLPSVLLVLVRFASGLFVRSEPVTAEAPQEI